MTRERLFFIAVLLVVFATGMGIGWFLGSTPDVSVGSENKAARSTTAGASSFSDSHPDDFYKNRVKELEDELAEQTKNQGTVVLNDRVAILRKHTKKISLQAVDDNLNITPEMADILNLTPEEKQAVEQHLKQIQDEMEKLEEARMTQVKQTADSLTVELLADPAGKELKAQLGSLLAGDIGSARADLFINSEGYSSNTPFYGFATAKQEIEISWKPQSDGKATMYTFNENMYDSDGNSCGSMSFSRNSLPMQYQKLFQTSPTP